jgi:hypothetical protein
MICAEKARKCGLTEKASLLRRQKIAARPGTDREIIEYVARKVLEKVRKNPKNAAYLMICRVFALISLII